MRRRQLLLVPLFLLLVAAKQRAVQHTPSLDTIPRDIYSFAEPAKITVTHIALDLTVDFDARRMRGSATLQLDNKTGTRTLVLDTRDLTIEKITLDDGRTALYSLGQITTNGAPLTIGIEPTTRSVKIEYVTSNNASGLYWYTAAQSLGRVQPYLWSQNEATDARSWIPLQDTPTVRATYEATLRVPLGLMALMSAENPTATNATGVYTFRMPYAIPSYLIAVGVGRFEFRALDERTGVYAEPELIEDAAWDLSYVPEMVDAAERIAGPYPFGRYDILLMPPGYPLGGMEHPRLNFINPFAVVNGNRLARPTVYSLVAHELAHSWAGDLTTLATWHDVWLNEGITTYLQERIIEELEGAERGEYAFYFHRRNFEPFATQANARTTLLHRPSQITESPNNAFTPGAYTKGGLFMKTLEDRIGRATFDVWLREYFERFAWRWVDDRNFLAFLRGKGLDRVDLDVMKWIYEPGLPSNITAPTSSALYDRIVAAANAFRTGTAMTAIDTRGWGDIEIENFLQLASQTVRLRMAEVDAVLALSSRKTPPLTWMTLGIGTGYTQVLPAVERVLRRGGTNGQLLTLYSALSTSSATRPLARQLFLELRDTYESNVAKQIEQILRGNGALQEEPAASVWRRASSPADRRPGTAAATPGTAATPVRKAA